ncbi:MAG: glycosyltransferase family 8 protein [Pseudomonadota bacterium]
MDHFVLAADNNVVGPLCVVLRSLKLSHDPAFTVHLFDCGIAPDNLARVVGYAASIELDLQIYDLDVAPLEEMRVRVAENPNLVAASFARLMMGSLLDDAITRAVYLDTDVVVTRGLHELFTMPMDGAIIAAVNEGNDHLVDLGISTADYFNSGVCVVDLVAWRAEGIEAATLDVIDRQGSYCMFFDQCALNIALHGRVKYLPGDYNHYTLAPGGHTTGGVPAVVHYTAPPKPWDAPQKHAWGALYCVMSETTPWPTDFNTLAEAAERRRKGHYRRLNPFFRAILKHARKRGAL